MAQSEHRRGCGIVGNEHGCEVLVVRPGPMERARDGLTATDVGAFGEERESTPNGEALNVAVELVIDQACSVRGQGCLIAEPGRPGRQRGNLTSLVDDTRLHLDDVGVVKTESLANDQILVGVLESDVSRRCLRTFMRRDVERRTQAIAEALVIGPQRQWVTVLRRCSGIDEIERTVLNVVLEFLQDPGLDLRATVGERDAVETVFDDSFSLTGSLLSYSMGGNGRNSSR